MKIVNLILTLFTTVKGLCETDWITYGFSLQRGGLDPYVTNINSSTASKLTPKWTMKLIGGIVAQPVIVLNYDISNSESSRRFLSEFNHQNTSTSSCPLFNNAVSSCIGCEMCPDGSIFDQCSTTTPTFEPSFAPFSTS
jgi:hypothetical protein